jgi:hypothetical protein
MPLLPPGEWRIAEAIAPSPHGNPFLPERLELDRRGLGDDYVEIGPVFRAAGRADRGVLPARRGSAGPD